MMNAARYWRLRFISNNGDVNIRIDGIEFKDFEDTPDFAIGGEYIASFGDEITFPWEVDFVPGEVWLGYAFPDYVMPRAITIFASGDTAPEAAMLEASNDGEVWYSTGHMLIFEF